MNTGKIKGQGGATPKIIGQRSKHPGVELVQR